MAKRKSAKASADKGAAENRVPAADKIAGLLALIATKEMGKDDAALKLDAIGFDAREISALLDVGPNYVNVARHRKKKPRNKG
jgi:hypothetical protein